MDNKSLPSQTSGVWQESAVSLPRLRLPNETQHFPQETRDTETQKSWKGVELCLELCSKFFSYENKKA